MWLFGVLWVCWGVISGPDPKRDKDQAELPLNVCYQILLWHFPPHLCFCPAFNSKCTTFRLGKSLNSAVSNRQAGGSDTEDKLGPKHSVDYS